MASLSTTTNHNHNHNNNNNNNNNGNEHFDYLFKMVMVGNSGVGKSCLLTRFADDAFCDTMTSTIGVDFRVRTLDVGDGRRAKLQVWDSAGQERFRALTASYYRGAHAVCAVFDVTDCATLDAVRAVWMGEIDRHCVRSARRILIGNKSDLHARRQVSVAHAASVADACGMTYVETSAKTAHNVLAAFDTVVRSIIDSDAHAIPYCLGDDGTVRISKHLNDGTATADADKHNDNNNGNKRMPWWSLSHSQCCQT